MPWREEKIQISFHNPLFDFHLRPPPFDMSRRLFPWKRTSRRWAAADRFFILNITV